MRKLKVLELYSGTRSIGKAFERKGHEVYSVDWDKKFRANWHADIELIKPENILERFGRPDVMWLSPDCTTYSIAAISTHRTQDFVLGGATPKTDYARKCDRTNLNTIRLIRDLRPPLFFIENPRGMMRKMPWMQWATRYTITYCTYTRDLPANLRRMKPTDIWTNHPDPQFKKPCKNGDPCHARAPRGAKTGTQGLRKVDRSRIPDALCDHIVRISEDYISRLDAANEWLVSQGKEPLTPIWDDADVIEPEPQLRLDF